MELVMNIQKLKVRFNEVLCNSLLNTNYEAEQLR